MNLKLRSFHHRKHFQKSCIQNVNHFVQASICYQQKSPNFSFGNWRQLYHAHIYKGVWHFFIHIDRERRQKKAKQKTCVLTLSGKLSCDPARNNISMISVCPRIAAWCIGKLPRWKTGLILFTLAVISINFNTLKKVSFFITNSKWLCKVSFIPELV